MSTLATPAPRADVARLECCMDRWRKRLFVAMRRNAADAAEYFRLSDRRTVTLGWQIPL